MLNTLLSQLKALSHKAQPVPVARKPRWAHCSSTGPWSYHLLQDHEQLVIKQDRLEDAAQRRLLRLRQLCKRLEIPLQGQSHCGRQSTWVHDCCACLRTRPSAPAFYS